MEGDIRVGSAPGCWGWGPGVGIPEAGRRGSGVLGRHGSGTGDGGGTVGVWGTEGQDGVRDTRWHRGWQRNSGDIRDGRGATERTGCYQGWHRGSGPWGWPRVTGLWHLQRVLVVSPVSLRVPLPCGPACCSLWPCWALFLPATLVSAPHAPACSQEHPGDTLSPCHPNAMPTPLMPRAWGWQWVAEGPLVPTLPLLRPAAPRQPRGVPAGEIPRLHYTVVKKLRTYAGAQVRGRGARGVPGRARPTAALPGGARGHR